MKTIEKLKVKISYDKKVDDELKTKSKTYSNLSTDVDDEKVLQCGRLIGSLIAGNEKRYYRIEEALLGKDGK